MTLTFVTASTSTEVYSTSDLGEWTRGGGGGREEEWEKEGEVRRERERRGMMR